MLSLINMISELERRLVFIIVICIFSFGVRNVCGQYCEENCQRGIDQVQQQASEQHGALNRKVEELTTRVARLDSNEYGAEVEIRNLAGRVNSLENHLRGNVSSLSRQIEEETNSLERDLLGQISRLRSNLTRRIDELTREIHTGNDGHGHHHTTPHDVYLNLTKRIDGLESGRINSLVLDNGMWRRNFQVVNRTFQRLKRCNC